MELEQRDFRADPLKLKRLRVAAGMIKQQFVTASTLDPTTAGKVLGGKPVFLNSLAIAVREVFGIDNPTEVLHPEELAALGMVTAVPGDVQEWDIAEYLTGWRTTANGLQYQVAKLRHRYLNGRSARGKCYELRHLPSTERDRLETHLGRHAEVCEPIGALPNIASNITAAWANDLWWVIDRWQPGRTLAERTTEGPVTNTELKWLTVGIADGLAALHQADIIRRELSPHFVLPDKKNGTPVLTDFELAKLAEGPPTVAPDEWPDDLYRAPEVAGDAPVDARADIYSWGRVFVHAAVGDLPERGKETDAINALEVPDPVKEIVEQSVALPHSKRPAKITAVAEVLQAWR